MIEIAESNIVFEDPEHDFRQRISFQREGDTLNARVDGMINGEAREEKSTWKREKSR